MDVKLIQKGEAIVIELLKWKDGKDYEVKMSSLKENNHLASNKDEYGSKITFFYTVNPLFAKNEGRESGEAQKEDVVFFVPKNAKKVDSSLAKSELWVDNFAKKEPINAEWLLRQCKRHKILNEDLEYNAESLCAAIYDLLKQNPGADISDSLCNLLGFSNMEFISLINEKRVKLFQLAVEANKKTIDNNAGGFLSSGFSVITAEEKKLQRLMNRDRKKSKKQKNQGPVDNSSLFNDYGRNEDFQFTIGEDNVLLKDPLLLRSSFQDIQTATGVEINSYSKQTRTESSGLPPGTITKKREGHFEYHVPYARIPEKDKAELVPIDRLDAWARVAFEGYTHFNRIQSKIFDTAYNTNSNLLICAPTGAGKTNVALLAILQAIKEYREDYPRDIPCKIVYIAPMKALAAEMVEGFSRRLKKLNVSVREYTGDMTLTKRELSETNIIVSTPEKWDVTTRKPSDIAFVSEVTLLIFDEVHLLHEERGPVIEAIVARTLRQVESTQQQIRIVGLSATLPNYIDVGTFLRVDPPVGLFYFDASYRPVPLTQQYIGVSVKDPARQKIEMNKIAYEKMMDSVRKKNQVMVFVHSRRDTVKTAEQLLEFAQLNGETDYFQSKNQIPDSDIQRAKSSELKKLLINGYGVHHAGMLRSDRNIVERLFSQGYIKTLVCTATLAWGVNLPAHTVIIKGTQIYDAKHGSFVDIGMLDIMQIFGRAGRPQFDTSGEGIIISTEDKAQEYLRLLNNQLPIESQFHTRLADNLNAEISLGTVTNIEEAITWISYTYWFVRLIKNPLAYGISQVSKDMDPTLYQYRKTALQKAAETLHKCKMVRFEKVSGSLMVTQLGRIASNYYIEHETIHLFNGLFNKSMNDAAILFMMSQAHEFNNITIREEESGELEELMNKYCFIQPVKGGVDNPYGKVNILLQAYISRAELKNFALVSDAAYVAKNASRIFRGLLDFSLFYGYANLSIKLLRWSKMVEKRLWVDFQHPLRQFESLKPIVLMKLEDKKLDLDKLLDYDKREISNLLGYPDIGKVIKNYIARIPYLSVELTVLPITCTIIQTKIDILADFIWDPKFHGSAQGFWIWIEDEDLIFDKKYFVLTKDKYRETHSISFDLPLRSDPRPSYYVIRIISDTWIGSELEEIIPLGHIILPEEYLAPTPLLELLPLPLSALQNKNYEKIFNFTHFNPIQTQLYHTMIHTDHNVLLGAPTGSGKTTIAELAMFRIFNTYPQAKIVYIGNYPPPSPPIIPFSLFFSFFLFLFFFCSYLSPFPLLHCFFS